MRLTFLLLETVKIIVTGLEDDFLLFALLKTGARKSAFVYALLQLAQATYDL